MIPAELTPPTESPPARSASDLLKEWKKAIQERDKIISDRADSMFLGKMGIEEYLNVLQNDARMNAYFMNRLIEAVAAIESKSP